MRIITLYIAVAVTICCFSFKSRAQTTGSTTPVNPAVAHFWGDTTCNKQPFYSATFSSINGHVRDTFVNSTHHWVIIFTIDNAGAILEVNIEPLQPNTTELFSISNATNAFKGLLWPLCEVPYTLTSDNWRVIIPCSNYPDLLPQGRSEDQEYQQIPVRLQALITKLQKQGPSIVCPPVTMTFYPSSH